MGRESAYEVGYREGAASAAEDVKTIKAEALREAAAALEEEPRYAEWLRDRAQDIEDGTL